VRQKSVPEKEPATEVVKKIRRATRRHFSAEDKIRVVLEGLRGEDSIAELCRREGIVQNLYYRWSKDFLEAGKKRLAGDTARAATSDEVKDLRREASALKEVVAELTCGRHVSPETGKRNGNVSSALLPNPTQLRILDVALAEDFSIRSLSARAALYARPRSKMAREGRAQRWVRELDREENIDKSWTYDHHGICRYYRPRVHGRRDCHGVGQLRSCERHPRSRRETAWRLLCPRRTGNPLDGG
jgi:transposase